MLKWFRAEDERHGEQAATLRGLFQQGGVEVVVPRLLEVEVLNVAGRGWRMAEHELLGIVREYAGLRFEVRDPSMEAVVPWIARGLSAYDAIYVALAEAEGIPLITDDDALVALAPRVAQALEDQPTGPAS